MTKIAIALAAFGAAALMAGAAQAGSVQPVAGNMPFFDPAAVSVGALTRAQVHADAIAHRPAVGELTQFQSETAPGSSTLTRAQVHQDLLKALAAGYHVKSGMAS